MSKKKQHVHVSEAANLDNDLWYWVTKDLTPEVIQRERERLKKEGRLIETETPFGTLSVLKHKAFDNDGMDEAFAVSPISEDSCKKLVDVAMIGSDHSAKVLVITQQAYNELTELIRETTGNSPENKQEVIEYINNRKFPADSFIRAGVSSFQIDELIIQPGWV